MLPNAGHAPVKVPRLQPCSPRTPTGTESRKNVPHAPGPVLPRSVGTECGGWLRVSVVVRRSTLPFRIRDAGRIISAVVIAAAITLGAGTIRWDAAPVGDAFDGATARVTGRGRAALIRTGA